MKGVVGLENPRKEEPKQEGETPRLRGMQVPWTIQRRREVWKSFAQCGQTGLHDSVSKATSQGHREQTR